MVSCVFSRLDCDAECGPEWGAQPGCLHRSGCSFSAQLCCPRFPLCYEGGQNWGRRTGLPGCVSGSHGQRILTRVETEEDKLGPGPSPSSWKDLMLREQPGWGGTGAWEWSIELLSKEWSPEEAMILPPAGPIWLRRGHPLYLGLSFLHLSRGDVNKRALLTPGTAGMKNNGILEKDEP